MLINHKIYIRDYVAGWFHEVSGLNAYAHRNFTHRKKVWSEHEINTILSDINNPYIEKIYFIQERQTEDLLYS